MPEARQTGAGEEEVPQKEEKDQVNPIVRFNEDVIVWGLLRNSFWNQMCL